MSTHLLCTVMWALLQWSHFKIIHCGGGFNVVVDGVSIRKRNDHFIDFYT